MRSKPALTNTTALAGRRVADGALADPPLVGRFRHRLIPRIRRDTHAVGRIVQAGVDHVHGKCEQIARTESGREPASAELFAERDRVGRQ